MEKILKRFLKRKVKVTLGLVVSFMISGTVLFAEEITEIKGSVTGNNITGNQIATGDLNIEGQIYHNNDTSGNSKGVLNLNNHNLDIKYKKQLDKAATIYNSKIINGGIIKFNNYATNNIYAEKGTTEISTKEIHISSGNIGLQSTGTNETKISLNADIINIKSSNGIVSQNGGKIIIKGKNKDTSILNINASSVGIHMKAANVGGVTIDNFSKVSINAATYGNGILINNKGGMTNPGTINVKADEITVSGGNGISILGIERSDNISTVNLQGNKVTINSTGSKPEDSAIKIEDGGIVNINAGEEDTGSVVVNGNMSFTGSESLEANANINFKTEDSQFNGKITTEESKASSNIEFSNGATWNNTGDSNVTNLTLDGGVINNIEKVEEEFNDITVGTLTGKGGTINMGAEVKDGTATSGEIKIGEVKEDTKFDINYSGNSEADSSKVEEYFKDLAGNIKIDGGDGNVDASLKLEESFVSGEYTADANISKGGATVENVKIGNLNTMIEGIRDLGTINLLTWRQEMSSLNQRMGELRNSTGEQGTWARIYSGKIKNGSQYDNKYQTYQVGYDKKYAIENGTVFVGGLVSYSIGETNYSHGEGENYSVGVGVYTTWLNKDGQFADIVLKQSRLHNKFDVKSRSTDLSQHGDYNNWGTSLSGQYGKRFDLNNKFFIEPSAQLTFGRVENSSYSTSAGVRVHQDTMYSLVGNLGTAVGYNFSEKGNVYVRAGIVREFQGDIDTKYSKDDVVERTSDDLKDTWGEFGVGANYKVAENVNVYVDLQRTGEATVDTKWQANLGFRYEF